MNRLDIIIYRLAIWRIKAGYGGDCETSDLDDFPEMLKENGSKYVENSGRCASCRAKETINFLEESIDLIKWSNKKDE